MLCTEEVDSDDVNIDEQSAAAAQRSSYGTTGTVTVPWAGHFMKLFRTSDISVIAYCREMFQFDLPSAILKKRAEKFDSASFN